MSGTTDKVKGTVKDTVGNISGDKRTQAEGKTDKAKGAVKNAADDVKDSVKGVGDSLKRD